MKPYRLSLLYALLMLLLAGARANAQSPNVQPNIFNVAIAPYNADTSGKTDCTDAIQQAVNDAIAYGNANNHTPVEVLLPAGTYLIGNSPTKGAGPVDLSNGGIGSNNLTFTGAGTASTMIWYTRVQCNAFALNGNTTNITIENFSADVQKLSSGQYDLGLTQGTVTAFNPVSNQVTVKVEAGYPPLNRLDLQNAPDSQGYADNTLWVFNDPLDRHYDSSNAMEKITPSPDGTTAVITLNTSYLPWGNLPFAVGAKWMIWPGHQGPNTFFLTLSAYGYPYNGGAITLQNVDFYGGGVNWMGSIAYNGKLGEASGNANADSGANPPDSVNFTNVYCGPPPYQPDRLLTCDEGWAASASNREAINVTNSTFLGTWDDILDIGCGNTRVLAQPATNQVEIQGTLAYDWMNGDTVQIEDDTDAPTGTVYATAHITSSGTANDGNPLITLDANVSVKNLGANGDVFTDLNQAGPITIANSTFNNMNFGHILLRSGSRITVTGSTIINGTPLVMGGFNGQGPNEVKNATVTGCTFQNSGGLNISESSQAVAGNTVMVANNTFNNCGRYGTDASNPLIIDNIAGVTVMNNTFNNNWGVNAQFQYDTGVAVTGNTFNYPNQVTTTTYAPNQVQYSNPIDTSVVYFTNVAGGSLSGNLVSGAGPYTNYLTETGANVSGVSGIADGITDLDNPLAFSFAYDGLVVDQPAGKTALDQASWTAAKSQLWTALPTTAGSFTLTDCANGQYVGNGTSQTAGASIVVENPTGAQEQNWMFADENGTADNVLNDYSNYAINVIGNSNGAGQPLCQWYAGNASNQDITVVTAPTASATAQFGSVTLTWDAIPSATGYNIARATKSGGPYTTIATGLTADTYIDTAVTRGTTYDYVVIAAGLPVSNGQSNQVVATPGNTFTPVNMAAAFDTTGIEPNGWLYDGEGLDDYGYTYSASLLGSQIKWGSSVFTIAAPGKPDAASDSGQRVVLPPGNYTTLAFLASYVGGGPGTTGTFEPTVTYTDGTRVVLSQGMTNWCGTASQTNESNVATYSYRNMSNGSEQTYTNYLHGYKIALDPTKEAMWLDLPGVGDTPTSIPPAPGTVIVPGTGNVRLLAMDLTPKSGVLSEGQYLATGDTLASPSAKCYLTQRNDGTLALYAGTPASPGALLWVSPNTGQGNVFYTTLQGDGNLVTYQGGPGNRSTPIWASATYTGRNGYYLQVTDAGQVQILSSTTVIWQMPAPSSISSLSPAQQTAGTAAFTLTINGTGFVSNSKVTVNGTALTTHYVSANQVTAAVTAAVVAYSGTLQVIVTNASAKTVTDPAILTVLPAPTLTTGQALLSGEYLVTPDGQDILIQLANGNLVLYQGSDPQHEGAILWQSGYSISNSAAFYTVMQGDGNLVTYMGTPSTPGPYVWATMTYGDTITALQLVNGPHLQLVDGSTVVQTLY